MFLPVPSASQISKTKHPPTVTGRTINGVVNPRSSPAPPRKVSVAATAAAAAATGPRSDFVPTHRNRHPSSSIPVYPKRPVSNGNSRPTSPNKVGNGPNGLNLNQDVIHLNVQPPQPPSVSPNGIGTPLSTAEPTVDSDSNTTKTPMEMLAESMKGRMLFAIPKKGAFRLVLRRGEGDPTGSR